MFRTTGGDRAVAASDTRLDKGMVSRMAGVDTRNIGRDSLLLTAEVRLEGEGDPVRVKVRNLSAGGMMGEGDLKVARGSRVVVALRNVGEIEGNVAWVQGNRFGIAFNVEIDPKAPRTAVAATPNDMASPRYTRPAGIAPLGEAEKLRKL
ncbi:PilZ domain-containing protein [Tsuneonella mangrovi]|uniref:PilZ domain-containing protein n=1 Tax=Tsuneonella mangrovi TaxID=1982042 RepID=UPI001F0AA7CA|nr:PilZ domain-containing protein [Tsuneonella mangrovi]